MLLKLLLAPITAPVGGIAWIADKILEQADIQGDDVEALQKQLLALQLSFDMGELPEQEFEDQEEALLLAIQSMQDQATDNT